MRLVTVLAILAGCGQDNSLNKQGGDDSDTPVDTATGDTNGGDTADTSSQDTADTDTAPVYSSNSTCNGVDNDGDGAENAPIDLVVDVAPGNGQCVVHVSAIFADEETITVQTCDEGAYVACNATDSSATVTPIVGTFYPDGCATAMANNATWSASSTTCGWLVRQPAQ